MIAGSLTCVTGSMRTSGLRCIQRYSSALPAAKVATEKPSKTPLWLRHLAGLVQVHDAVDEHLGVDAEVALVARRRAAARRCWGCRRCRTAASRRRRPALRRCARDDAIGVGDRHLGQHEGAAVGFDHAIDLGRRARDGRRTGRGRTRAACRRTTSTIARRSGSRVAARNDSKVAPACRPKLKKPRSSIGATADDQHARAGAARVALPAEEIGRQIVDRRAGGDRHALDRTEEAAR